MGSVVLRYDRASSTREEPDENETDNQKKSEPVILLADDSEADRFFLMRTFTASGIKDRIHAVSSGAEVISYLTGQGKYSDRSLYPLPRIVFIDLQMPPPNGFEVLRWKQSRAAFTHILWVAMSGLDAVKTINEAYSAGASTFLVKPINAADLRNLIGAFKQFRSTDPRP